MEARMNFLTRILALGAAALALSACSVARVNNFEFGASEAPEVRGPSTYIEPNENIARVSASLIAADEDEVLMPVKSRKLDERVAVKLSDVTVSTAPKKVQENYARLDIGGYSFAASVDFILKWDAIFFQLGLAYYDGAYYYASLGTNHKYYEYGVFVGEFHQITRVKYYGYWCSVDGCTQDDRDDKYESTQLRMLSDVFLGGYAGLHFWRLSLNYTLSLYTPSLDVPDLSYTMPMIVSNYLSAGIKITDNLMVRGGAVASLVRTWSKPHLGLKFSIDYNIGESKSSKNKYESSEEAEPAAKSETFAAPAPTVETEIPAETEPAAETESATESEPTTEAETVAESETAAEAEPVAENETPAENSAEEPAEAQTEESAE
ncbi:hypothetical protein B7994_08355 [Fibrobacter sp. UWR2]|nr:hypothetical protein B7994_08355 [Fibrobacter sp. UWR2]